MNRIMTFTTRRYWQLSKQWKNEGTFVRAIYLSLWELLLKDWNRASREILNILQDRQRSTNLAEKSLENILRILVSRSYLNIILSILFMISTIS